MKRTLKGVMVIVFGGFVVLLGWGLAWPQAEDPWGVEGLRGLSLGPVVFHPGVSVRETYTDNFFLEPNERWEWITTITPSLGIHLPLRRHALDFEYRSDFYEMARHNQYDWDYHFLNGRLTLDFPGGLIIRAGHAWEADSNPPTFNGDDRKRYKRNVSSLEAEYSFTDRYSVGLRYGHSFVRFNKERWEVDEFDLDEITLDLNYRILPKTRVFLRGGWAYERFPEREPISTDNYNYLIWVGARTTPAAKIVGILAGGYSRREWDDDRAGDPVNAFGVRGDVYYDLTPRTRFSLIVARTIETTTESTTDNIAFGSSYILTEGTLGVRQSFTSRLSASARLGFGLREYSGEGPGALAFEEDRSDTLFFANAAMDYRIWRYIFLGLQYRFVDNESNRDEEDYTENRFMVSVAFRI